MGSFLGSGGLYFLCRKSNDPRQDLALGALLPSLLWVAMGGSFFFPEARGLESEFSEKVPQFRSVRIDEKFSSVLALMLIGAGYFLERRRQTNQG